GNPVINTVPSFPRGPVDTGHGAHISLSWHPAGWGEPRLSNHGGIPAVPTNEQRRATAKRKLERQLERRQKQARRRRILLIVVGSIVALAVVAAVVITVINSKNEHKSNTAATTTPAGSPAATTTAAPQTGPVPPLPPFKPSANTGANCQY